MSLIPGLVALRSPLLGTGTNHEGEQFVGRMDVSSLVSGKAVMLTYTATGTDGAHLHAESTLIGESPNGALCLWPVMEELPFVLPHQEAGRVSTEHGVKFIFASGPRDEVDAFREEISIELQKDGTVIYSHAWGMPGEAFDERSSCHLTPSAA